MHPCVTPVSSWSHEVTAAVFRHYAPPRVEIGLPNGRYQSCWYAIGIEDSPEGGSDNAVKGFTEVDESDYQWYLVFMAFFYDAPQGEDLLSA